MLGVVDSDACIVVILGTYFKAFMREPKKCSMAQLQQEQQYTTSVPGLFTPKQDFEVLSHKMLFWAG